MNTDFAFLKKELRKLSTPEKIQDYLNSIPFNFETKGETCMSPLFVLKKQKAHCLEGALFAATALYLNGITPYLLDLKSSKEDFDHVVCVFKREGYLGAISKTNHGVLRYREPVYKTVRELALSYFHEYFLEDGTKTLESYSRLYNVFQKNKDWITEKNDLWDIGAQLDESHHILIAPKKILKKLRKADTIEIRMGKITEW